MLYNGWEFFILNPLESDIKQTTQETYINMYNKAYNILLNQLCIPEPNDLLEDNLSFTYYIDFTGDNDIIDLEEKYDYTFLKSVFLDKKNKKIFNDVNSYYKQHNIDVINMYRDNSELYLILKK